MSADNHTYPEKTVGSLFSGIGGLDLGLERAGWRVVWQAETDPYASKILHKHWPDVPNLGDVTQIDWSTIDRPDLVCGGFPCQPVSRAGKRRAQDDERWLWPEMLRAVSALRPRFVLVENVPGLFVHGMGDVLGDLAAIGYNAEWEGIPAAAVGAPHIRDRVWIVAHTDSSGRDWKSDGDEPQMAWPHRLPSERGESVGQSPRSGGVLVDASGGRHRAPQATLFPRRRGIELSSWWEFEPNVGRVAHGIPDRMDRLRCLGNAVVPQVAELVARMWLP